MELFNADGGKAEVSGNGVRALAALLLLDDDRDGASVTITTGAGPKRVTRLGISRSLPAEASAEAGPTFRTPMGLPPDVKQVPLHAGGEPIKAVVLNFGHPQGIILGPQPSHERVDRRRP